MPNRQQSGYEYNSSRNTRVFVKEMIVKDNLFLGDNCNLVYGLNSQISFSRSRNTNDACGNPTNFVTTTTMEDYIAQQFEYQLGLFTLQLPKTYRLISENVPIKNGNILIIPSSINENIDNYKFTLGINYLFSNEKYFSYRLRDFESPAHGTCHLTQTDPNLEKIFLPNISMLYYRDKQDLIEMANYYLNTKVGKIEAKKIGLKAREVAKNNTWGKRLEEIYKYFEEDK